jgi:hypothetical protein
VAQRALFQGLVIDELGEPVQVSQLGDEAFYVVDDAGFLRHVESELVDRQVLARIFEMIEGHEDMISESTMRMLGQEDIFTKAAIEQSLKRADEQFDALLQTGIPQDMLTWLGMMGFQVRIDYRGQVLEIIQPAGQEDPDA